MWKDLVKEAELELLWEGQDGEEVAAGEGDSKSRGTGQKASRQRGGEGAQEGRGKQGVGLRLPAHLHPHP